MTQHTDLIERLRASSEDGLTPDDAYAAAEALEAQAREIAELKAQESELCTLYGLAQAECKKLRAEVEGLRAARMAYASEFPPDGEGEPDVGSIHQNIRAMKAEIEGLRKNAERYQFLRDCDLDDMAAKYWPGGQVPTGEEFDAAIDAANRRTP